MVDVPTNQQGNTSAPALVPMVFVDKLFGELDKVFQVVHSLDKTMEALHAQVTILENTESRHATLSNQRLEVIDRILKGDGLEVKGVRQLLEEVRDVQTRGEAFLTELKKYHGWTPGSGMAARIERKCSTLQKIGLWIAGASLIVMAILTFLAVVFSDGCQTIVYKWVASKTVNVENITVGQ